MEFTHYAMPVYTHDHVTYCNQMNEWHIKMHHYHEQIKVHHLEQAKHFQKMAGDRLKTSDYVA